MFKQTHNSLYRNDGTHFISTLKKVRSVEVSMVSLDIAEVEMWVLETRSKTESKPTTISQFYTNTNLNLDELHNDDRRSIIDTILKKSEGQRTWDDIKMIIMRSIGILDELGYD